MATEETEYGQVDQLVFRLSAEPDGQAFVWDKEGWQPFPMTAGEVRELMGFRVLTREGLADRGIIH